ncbi:NAD-dependent epimerase/dehydratase family protein [Roseivivax sp. CAU 1753]
MPHWVFLGASGRVGKLLANHWRQVPQQKFSIDYQTRRTGSAGLLWSPLDGPEAFLNYVRQSSTPTGLFVFLGATPGQATDMDLNLALAKATLDAAAEAGVSRVLLASTSAVYGVGEELHEMSPLRPVNEYGHAKARMEDACTPYRNCGVNVCCLRIGNVAGADALLKHRKSKNPRPIEQFEDGLGPKRSYIGPGTMCSVLDSLASQTELLPDSLNIATPLPVRMADLADAADMDWHYVPASSPASHQNITIDCSLLQTLHTFDPGDSQAGNIVHQLSDLE